MAGSRFFSSQLHLVKTNESMNELDRLRIFEINATKCLRILDMIPDKYIASPATSINQILKNLHSPYFPPLSAQDMAEIKYWLAVEKLNVSGSSCIYEVRYKIHARLNDVVTQRKMIETRNTEKFAALSSELAPVDTIDENSERAQVAMSGITAAGVGRS